MQAAAVNCPGGHSRHQPTRGTHVAATTYRICLVPPPLIDYAASFFFQDLDDVDDDDDNASETSPEGYGHNHNHHNHRGMSAHNGGGGIGSGNGVGFGDSMDQAGQRWGQERRRAARRAYS